VKKENWRRWARDAGLKRQREYARYRRAIEHFPDLREQLYGQASRPPDPKADATLSRNSEKEQGRG
jgi:hypothetical protein